MTYKPAWYARAYDRIGNVGAVEVIVVMAVTIAIVLLVVTGLG